MGGVGSGRKPDPVKLLTAAGNSNTQIATFGEQPLNLPNYSGVKKFIDTHEVIDLTPYVPYTGATTDVNLGSKTLTTTALATLGSITSNTINTTSDGSGSVGNYYVRYGNMAMDLTYTRQIIVESGSGDIWNVATYYLTGDLEINRTGGSGKVLFYNDVMINGYCRINGNSGTPGCVLWAEEGGAMSTATSGGLQYSFGNGYTGGQGVRMPAPGKVVAMSIECAASSSNVGRVQMAINGVAQGSSYQVSSPSSGPGGSYTTFSLSFSAGDRISFITTTSSATTSGIVMACWIVYD